MGSVRKFEVAPLSGVGPVLLGMTQEESRRAMGSPFKNYEKVAGTGCFVDAYFRSAFQVFFSQDNFVEVIELSRDSEIRAILFGIDVFSIAVPDLVAEVSRIVNADAETDDGGYCYSYPGLRLHFWRPVQSSADSESRYFETVGISAAIEVESAD